MLLLHTAYLIWLMVKVRRLEKDSYHLDDALGRIRFIETWIRGNRR
jgi:hypothetical protein